MKYCYLMLLCIFIICCAKKKEQTFVVENGSLFEKLYHENGQIKLYSKLNTDSIKDGISKEYFYSGNIKRISKYSIGLKDSTEMEYYESGSVKMKSDWKMGIKWGSEISYYDSLRDIYFYIDRNNDTLKVDAPMKKEYCFYDFNSKKVYSRKYDKEGEVIDEQGKVISIMIANEVEFQKGDTINLRYYVAQPEWVDYEFKVNIYDLDEKIIDSVELNLIKTQGSYVYSRILDDEGRYKIEAICKMMDQLSDRIRTDTTTLEVKVNGLAKS